MHILPFLPLLAPAFALPSGAKDARAGVPARPPVPAAAAKIARDFVRDPLLVDLPASVLPAQVAVLPDVHAGANRLYPLLQNNGIIGPRVGAAPPGDTLRCGSMAQSEWGAFRWHNPWQWSFGNNTLVSLGDRINKGPFNLQAACFFADLAEQAEQAGGRVILQWGNHETATLTNYDNDKTRGPGGLLWELWGYGIAPQNFFGAKSAFFQQLARAPIATRLADQVVLVHGGVCPSPLSLEEELAQLQEGLEKDGFAAAALRSENNLVRCRIQRGRVGAVTRRQPTEVMYAHDPEHEPRGLPYCFWRTTADARPFAQQVLAAAAGLPADGAAPATVYCRTDVGMTPYINYSLGFVQRYLWQDGAFVRQTCNELGSCSNLTVQAQEPVLPPTDRQPSTLPAASEAGQAEWPRSLGGPDRAPHRGVDRNVTQFPTIVTLPKATGELYVLPDVLGALPELRQFLTGLGLVAPGKLLDPVRWTGGDSVLVAPGNLVGAGYFNLGTLDLFRQLAPQAEAAGGRVVTLLGAHEVDFLADPNNDDTWAGGGLAAELTGRGLWPEEFAKDSEPLYRWLGEQPFGLRILDLLVLPGGQTSNRPWRDLADNLAEALHLDGFGAAFIAGDNSITKKVDFAGRDGRQGPILAEDAGVTSIVHALNLDMEPWDEIKAYGKAGKTFSLFNVATRLNPSLGGGSGKVLRIQRRGKHLFYDALDANGHAQRVGKNPYHAHLAI